MTTPLAVAVVGLGLMGSRHARVLRRTPHLHLVAAVDPAGDRHQAATGVPVLTDISQLRRYSVDYAVLASPTTNHPDLGAELAAAGIPTLIEKPLAADLGGARDLREAFRRASIPAAVGYIERHQPAIVAMHRILNTGVLGDVLEISTHRSGSYPTRITDVGVLNDLATHDIDLTTWLTGQPYTSITARTAHHRGQRHEDLLTAIGQLADGTLVNHRVNWLSSNPAREVHAATAAGSLTADTLAGTLTLHHGTAEPPTHLPYPATTHKGQTRFMLDPLGQDQVRHPV